MTSVAADSVPINLFWIILRVNCTTRPPIKRSLRNRWSAFRHSPFDSFSYGYIDDINLGATKYLLMEIPLLIARRFIALPAVDKFALTVQPRATCENNFLQLFNQTSNEFCHLIFIVITKESSCQFLRHRQPSSLRWDNMTRSTLFNTNNKTFSSNFKSIKNEGWKKFFPVVIQVLSKGKVAGIKIPKHSWPKLVSYDEGLNQLSFPFLMNISPFLLSASFLSIVALLLFTAIWF